MNTDQILNEYLYRNIVLLYCPSKVGSTTIASSIRVSLSEKFFVFHTHDFTVAKIMTNGSIKEISVLDILRTAGTKNLKGENRKVYVIDIFRPQIERKISEYFQNLSEKHFNNYEENIAEFPIDKIIKRFNDIYPHIESIDYYKEIYTLCPKTFDFDKKYLIHKNNCITFIKLRLMDSKIWGNILSEIFEEKIFLIKDYESKNKKIGKIYKDFTDQYKIPFNFYQMEEECDQLKFYYSESERKEYLEKWKNKITDQHVSFNEQEYNVYQMISNENRFLFKNLNNHYFDDGCVCLVCSQKRKKILNKLQNGELPEPIENNRINHKYNETFRNEILLIMKNNNNGQLFTHTVNVINY